MDGKTQNKVMMARWCMFDVEEAREQHPFYAYTFGISPTRVARKSGSQHTRNDSFWSEGKSTTNTDARKIIIKKERKKM